MPFDSMIFLEQKIQVAMYKMLEWAL